MPIDIEEKRLLPRAHGHLDHAQVDRDNLEIVGWLLDPDRPLDSVEVYVDDERIGVSEIQWRQDVAQVLAGVPHAASSGFHLKIFGSNKTWPTSKLVRIKVVGMAKGRAVCVLSGLGRSDLGKFSPRPPEELIRMIGSPDIEAYRTQGLQVFGDILEAIRPVAAYGNFQRVLDWGSGCGRIAVHFLDHDSGPDLFGCDVVPELVSWCSDHLEDGRFSLIDPFPPTHFEDDFFDFVFSSSVMTHLNRDVQKLWLEEVRRILRPGGVFVTSTLGESAFLRDFRYARKSGLRARLKSLFGREVRDLNRCGGILDDITNRSLGSAVPADYYRNVYQTPEYTKRTWSEYFEIVQYVERGSDHYQDLVVMLRPV